MLPFFPDTAATLTHAKNLPMGIHDVDIDVQDQQSIGRVQTVRVRICECRNGVCLAKQRSVTFGPMGLLALLLPLFLLLLLCKSTNIHVNRTLLPIASVKKKCHRKNWRVSYILPLNGAFFFGPVSSAMRWGLQVGHGDAHSV